MFNTIIWDFNGTILDDLEINYSILTNLLKRRDLRLISKNEYLERFGFPMMNFYRNLGFDFEKEPFEVLADEYNELYQKLFSGLTLKEGVFETLNLLKDKNIEQVVLSASNKDHLNRQLNDLNISGYFNDILGLSDHYAHSKVSLAKSWIKNFEPENCKILMIGDTVHDFEVASAIGAECVLVCGGHNSKERLASTGAPVIENVTEVFNLLN